MSIVAEMASCPECLVLTHTDHYGRSSCTAEDCPGIYARAATACRKFRAQRRRLTMVKQIEEEQHSEDRRVFARCRCDYDRPLDSDGRFIRHNRFNPLVLSDQGYGTMTLCESSGLAAEPLDAKEAAA